MAKRRVKRKSVDRPYASGSMSVAGRHGFFMGLIRHGLMRWKPKHDCIKGSRVAQKGVNPATGREVFLHRCAHCEGLFMLKQMRADHIEPLVPLTGFVSWDDTFKRAFVEVEGFQAVCVECHKEKTAEESVVRKLAKKIQ